jgi:hypothetical protein
VLNTVPSLGSVGGAALTAHHGVDKGKRKLRSVSKVQRAQLGVQWLSQDRPTQAGRLWKQPVKAT